MIPKLQLRHVSFFILIFFLTTPLINSCKKADSLIDSKSEIAKEKNPENFFKLPANAPSIMQRIAKELEKQNIKTGFIKDFIAKDGFPIWNKSRIEKHVRIRNSQSLEGDGVDTIVYIPLVVSAQEYVHGFLKATVSDTVDFRIFRQNDYIDFPFQTPTPSTNVTTAENFAIRMMAMDRDVFGTTDFKLEDKRLFHINTNYSDTSDIQLFIKLNSSGAGNNNFASNGTDNVMYEICYNVYKLSRVPCFSGPNNNNTTACYGYTNSQVCDSYEEPSGGGGSGGPGWPYVPGGGQGGGSNPPCLPGGEPIVNGVMPIECTPGPGGNPWPPQTPQNWLDLQWMTYAIKDSTNNACVANVLNTIKSISSTLPELLRSVFDTSGIGAFNVTLKKQNWGYGETGETIRNLDDFDYKVRINGYYDNSTDLAIACTIFHEIFHCQLQAWFRQAYILNDTAKKRELATKWGYLFGSEITNIDSSLAYIVNNPIAVQHQAIATRYRSFIGQALFQFAQARGMSNITLEFCNDLALSGCQPSQYFQDLPGNGTINLLINTEKDPDGLLGLTPYPHPSPRGTRCL